MGIPVETREELKRLMKRKDLIEAEIEALTSSLNAPGLPGVSGPLVDREGFPLANVNVHEILQWRQRLICLHNDHKDCMESIEKILHLTIPADMETSTEHSQITSGVASLTTASAGASVSPSMSSGNGLPASGQGTRLDSSQQGLEPTESTSAGRASNGAAEFLFPFARVDAITPHSTAAAGGLQTGDQILRFGNVRRSDFSDNASAVRALSGTLADHVGVSMSVAVRRGGQQIDLSLNPARQVPLGCRVFPL